MSGSINEIVFRDIPLKFEPHPVTNNLIPTENDTAVKNALKNLILTNFYEVPYEPHFGSNVTKQLFENFSSMTSHILQKNIKDAVINFEPRVQLLEVNVSEDLNLGNLNVNIIFRIINKTEPVELNILIERVR